MSKQALTTWTDSEILAAVRDGHGMPKGATARAHELASLGLIDMTGTWKLTSHGIATRARMRWQAFRTAVRPGVLVALLGEPNPQQVSYVCTSGAFFDGGLRYADAHEILCCLPQTPANDRS